MHLLILDPRRYLGVINRSLMSKIVLCRQVGHFAAAAVPNKRRLAEFRVTEDALLPPRTRVTAAHFTAGQYVDIQGMHQLAFWLDITQHDNGAADPAATPPLCQAGGGMETMLSLPPAAT